MFLLFKSIFHTTLFFLDYYPISTTPKKKRKKKEKEEEEKEKEVVVQIILSYLI
jgi:hypothetical protein